MSRPEASIEPASQQVGDLLRFVCTKRIKAMFFSILFAVKGAPNIASVSLFNWCWLNYLPSVTNSAEILSPLKNITYFQALKKC